ncbi:MAG: hypothetical protein COA78_21630 [Blastopirellula sp.]|nr:MAG: hypothetical protein COA78_21630 [Blastopirellula sp.]
MTHSSSDCGYHIIFGTWDSCLDYNCTVHICDGKSCKGNEQGSYDADKAAFAAMLTSNPGSPVAAGMLIPGGVSGTSSACWAGAINAGGDVPQDSYGAFSYTTTSPSASDKRVTSSDLQGFFLTLLAKHGLAENTTESIHLHLLVDNSGSVSESVWEAGAKADFKSWLETNYTGVTWSESSHEWTNERYISLMANYLPANGDCCSEDLSDDAAPEVTSDECECNECGSEQTGTCSKCRCAEQTTPGLGSIVRVTNKYKSHIQINGSPAVSQKGLGYNWFSPAQPQITKDSSENIFVTTAGGTRRFTLNGEVYQAEDDNRGSLVLNSSNCSFEYEPNCPGSDGTLYSFDNTGGFRRITAPGGNEIRTTNNSDGNIAEQYAEVVQDGKTIKSSVIYDYFDSGDNSGLLKSVTEKRSFNPTTELNRIVYTYYGSDEEFGLTGDLKTATKQMLHGDEWIDLEASYYRYYKAGDANGFEHGMKYALKNRAFHLLQDDPQVSDPFSASNEKIAEYADTYYEYDANQRVTKSVTNGGKDTYTFSATTSAHADGFNNWKTKTTVTNPDGSQEITYSNYLQAAMLEKTVSGSDSWINYYLFDSNGRKIQHAHPAAIASYDDTQADLNVTLNASSGLIDVTDYYSTTTATASTPGGVEGYPQYRKVKEGTSGTEIKQAEITYFKREGDLSTIYPVAESLVFSQDDGTGQITTSFAYTWFAGTTQFEQRTTTLPVVSSSQNGTGSTDKIKERFDVDGNLVLVKDVRGYITYRVYDLARNLVIQEVQDVDGDKITLPSGWATPADGGLHLVTDYSFDAHGRNVQTLGPVHDVDGLSTRTANWTVYKDADDEVLSAQGYATGIDEDQQFTLINPVTIQRSSNHGMTSETIVAVRDAVGCSAAENCPAVCSNSSCCMQDAGTVKSPGPLSASDCFPQSSWVRWSRSFSNKYGQQFANHVYHEIPASGTGDVDTHYSESLVGYDELGRQNRSVSPTGTITRTVYNNRSLVASTWIGVNDRLATDADPTGSSAAGNNMVQISADVYDSGNDGGPGNLTQSTAYVDALTTRVMNFEYDFQNRQTVVDGELDFYQITAYNNLNQTTQIDRKDTNDAGNVISGHHTRYDDRGRVYQTEQFEIDPATGLAGNSLLSDTYFDAASNVLQSSPAGSNAFTKTVFDSLGRQIAQYVGYASGASSSGGGSGSGSVSGGSGTSTPSNIANDYVFEQTVTTYNEAGNVTFSTSSQRNHNATGTGELNGPSGNQPNSRDTYSGMWYDGVGRSVGSANFGTNDNNGAPTRADLLPDSSETILVTQTHYNDQDAAFKNVDAAGVVSRSYADAAGRNVRSIANYIASDDGCVQAGADQNVTTLMQYDSGGNMTRLTAVNADTGDQVTQYLYGISLEDCDLASNDILRAEVYPDSDSSTDRIVFTYNRQGQTVTRADQNGTVHSYSFDALGRQLADTVSTLGADVDNGVLRIEQSYEVRGLVETITSYDATTAGNVVNKIENVYNDFSQLTDQYQSHSGSVNTGTTPKVQYAYADGSLNSVRLSSVTYPDGKVLTYEYDSGDDDNLSRVSSLTWDSTKEASYTYLGMNMIVNEEYPVPGVELDYIGTNYSGFDRFGRVVDQQWKKGATDLVRLGYGYNQSSSRVYKEDSVAATNSQHFDESYQYDSLQSLQKFHRGDLSVDKQTITSPAMQQSWQLDATGNWNNFTQNDQSNSSNVLDQSRVANQVNEITEISRSVGSDWALPVHDANGNMTSIPQPSDMSSSYTATWDAWNRMVKLVDDADTVAVYNYDGRNQRVVKEAYVSGTLSETRHVYFSKQWQVLEERVDAATSADQQFIWGKRFVDDLVLRETSSETLYALQDANWNVTALSDTSGSIKERFAYSPYGESLELDPDFSAYTGTDYKWQTRFTGRELDLDTGLNLHRNRYLHLQLGNWISRDSIGYVDGHSLYGMYFALKGVDPNGNRIMVFGDPIMDCIHGCESHCAMRFPRWYQWHLFAGCVAGCQSGCNDEDFTPCSYIKYSMSEKYKAKLTCICGAVEIGDFFSDGFAPIAVLDCACEVFTSLNNGCSDPNAPGYSIMQAIHATDCFLDVLSSGGKFISPLEGIMDTLDKILIVVEEAYQWGNGKMDCSIEGCIKAFR